ncbi:MAG: hypothetical protein WB470_25180, partial [Candidatus Acidiferrales bacterium]
CSFKISLPNACIVLIFFIAGLLLCLEHVVHWERIASRWRPAFFHLVNAPIGKVKSAQNHSSSNATRRRELDRKKKSSPRRSVFSLTRFIELISQVEFVGGDGDTQVVIFQFSTEIHRPV